MPIFDALLDIEIHFFCSWDDSITFADVTLFLDNLAFPVAMLTSCLILLVEAESNLLLLKCVANTIAFGASFHVIRIVCPRPTAVRTENLLRQEYRNFLAIVDILESDPNFHGQVWTLLRSRLTTSSSSSEKLAEKISESASSRRSSIPQTVFSVLVVLFPLIRIG